MLDISHPSSLTPLLSSSGMRIDLASTFFSLKENGGG